MKRRAKSAHRSHPQPTGQLVGEIVYNHDYAREFLMNDFAVILQETAKTVVLAKLATEEQIDQECDYYRGREQPLLQDGKLAAAALVKVYRGIVAGGLIAVYTGKPPPKTTLLAHLWMDEKFIHHTVRIRARQPQPGEALVKVIRVNKDEPQGGPRFFSSRTHYPNRYYLWDGQAKGFAYPGFTRPDMTTRRS